MVNFCLHLAIRYLRMDAALPDIAFDFEYFFNLSADLICIAGFDGYFKKINPAVSRTLLYTEAELFSRPIDTFVHEDDRPLTGAKRKDIIKGQPLLNFENRYITKSGQIVWLAWTSMPVMARQQVFAIAKDITWMKNTERDTIHRLQEPAIGQSYGRQLCLDANIDMLPADRLWLLGFEALVRRHTGKTDISIRLLSNEMAMSERQLYRRMKQVAGITPNQYVRKIRLQLAKEAMESGKYRTLSELCYLAGFESPNYFSKLFKESYGSDVDKLL